MKEFDNTEEFSQIRDDKPSLEEYDRLNLGQERSFEFYASDDGKDSGQDKKIHNRKSIAKERNFLLQAASAMTAGLLVTTAFGYDILGTGEMFGGSLTNSRLESVLKENEAHKGVITISMLWSTTDDLDLHVVTPSGEEIFFGNPYAAGGNLDVDRQAGEFVEYPVENIYFDAPLSGNYTVYVQNFNDRSMNDTSVLVRVIVSNETKTYRLKIGGTGEQKIVCKFAY